MNTSWYMQQPDVALRGHADAFAKTEWAAFSYQSPEDLAASLYRFGLEVLAKERLPKDSFEHAQSQLAEFLKGK